MNRPATWILLAALAWGAGCASSGPKRAPAWTGNPADAPAFLSQVPPRDKVLWQYRIATTALRQGDDATAKALLDDALLRVGVILGGDRSARKSRSYFQEEAKKTFLGEPYERVMAFYYRGLLYWRDGEPDNARACYRNAQIQDSDTEERQYSSDYALLDYLDGLASVKLGGDGADAFQRAQRHSRGGPLPPYDRQANVLFFCEFGRGPTKFASGEYQEQLRFNPGGSEAKAVAVRVAGQTAVAGAYDDLSFQATTRGGRQMDHVLANKAVFKSATDTVGNVAIISGAAVAMSNQSNEAALGLLAFGLVSKLVAGATTPAADTRTWDNLPQHLSFAALRLPPGDHTATIEFLDASGRPLSTKTKTVQFRVDAASKDTVLFISDL